MIDYCVRTLMEMYPHRPLHELVDCIGIMEGVLNAEGNF